MPLRFFEVKLRGARLQFDAAGKAGAADAMPDFGCQPVLTINIAYESKDFHQRLER